MDESSKISRRGVLKQVIFLAVVGTGLSGRPAYAQKAPQQAMKYQDKPNGTQECDNCQHFQPPNACAIVDGKISPKGWCIAWVKKA